jgi:hypothetical protein
MLGEQVEKSIAGREQLIAATHEQTETFKRLSDTLTQKPCLLENGPNNKKP